MNRHEAEEMEALRRKVAELTAKLDRFEAHQHDRLKCFSITGSDGTDRITILLLLEMLGSRLQGAVTKTDLQEMEKRIMASQKEIADGLKLVAEQQQKTIGEINTLQGEVTTLKGKITELEKIISEGGEVTPELLAAFEAVKAQAQKVDDEIPDLPTSPPDTV